MGNLLTTTEVLPPRPAGSPRFYWQAGGVDGRSSQSENASEPSLFDTFEDAADDAKAWLVSLRPEDRPEHVWLVTFAPQSVGVITRH